MSHFCGWISTEPNPPEARDIIARMNRQAPGPAEPLLGSHAALAAGGIGPRDLCQVDGVLAAVVGNPRWRSGKYTRKGAGPASAADIADALGAYGVTALEDLQGRFAIAVLDDANQRAFLVVDRMGVCGLYYFQTTRGIVFGSRSAMMRVHPEVSAEVDPQALYDYLYFHMIPAPSSVFRHHRRMEPGSCLVMQGASVELPCYWRPRYLETEKAPFSTLQDEFLALLREAVREDAEAAQVGAFLSGGTDSSTVAGVLSGLSEGKAKTYSIGFDQEGYDEVGYARIAARHFGTEHHEYYVTPDDVLRAIPLVADAYDEPYGNASAVPTYYCAQMARADGVQRLLGGDGGDELFGGNTRYAKQHVFSHYERIPAYVRKSLLEPLLLMPSRPGNLPLLGKLQSYVRQASIPMPARMETYNLLQHFGPETVFVPEFLAAIDTEQPAERLATLYNSVRAQSQINRMLGVDLRHTLADNDLLKVTRMCEAAGVDAAFPMLNDALVSFSMRLAPRYKLRGTELRYFFKRALADFLPEAILKKQKHGFGLPFGAWMTQHQPLQQFVHDNLRTLRERGIVRKKFIDRLSHSLLNEHTAYYGTMIWLLLMLEQWCRREQPDLRL